MALRGCLVYVVLDQSVKRMETTDEYIQLLQGGLGVTAFVSIIPCIRENQADDL